MEAAVEGKEDYITRFLVFSISMFLVIFGFIVMIVVVNKNRKVLQTLEENPPQDVKTYVAKESGWAWFWVGFSLAVIGLIGVFFIWVKGGRRESELLERITQLKLSANQTPN